ncbi:Rpn family recombination-promoting nuclease/putative transposase [bacterium]|nr:Rpn family recombination-promoting nuclease/putative transposase [bacterium]
MALHTNLSFETATGSIDYPFTNDYMFRAILQKDKQVLKALIAALLHLKKESIHDVAITNPIELGAAISDKDFILDIRVNLNNEQLIDLEMQMSNEYNWSERSISYAARSFDQLNSGEEYKEVLPVHSIGFLNFTLFENQPEFFATYELRNKKTGHLYSSKFSIHVLDLTRIDLATAEDQNYEIDRWAKLFKAKTWEELRMIAKNNPDLLQASNDLYTVNADEIIRQQARARADAEFWERNKNAKIKQLEDTIIEQDNTIAENQKLLAEKDAELLRLQKELAKLKQL